MFRFLCGKDGKMSEWQPIETAPMDGTDILVCVTRNLPDDGWETIQWVDWQTKRVRWPTYRDRDDIPFPPTHWMPLPEPPSASRRA